MRFLFAFILIGAILGSQIAFAQGEFFAFSLSSSSSASTLQACKTHALERRAVRMIRAHRMPNCQPKAPIGVSSSSSSRVSSASSVSSSRASVLPLDPNSDTDIRSQFLLLGEVGPILGAASIFIEEEPLQVTSISINLTQEVPTVSAMLVYDDQRRFLGTALLDPTASTNRTYKVTLAPDAFTVDKRDERKIYVRPRLLGKDTGGQSNHIVQIGSVLIRGNGVWSSQSYTKVSPSTDRFPAFVTARSTITSVKSLGDPVSYFLIRSQAKLGTFQFTGRKSDASAHIDITDLTFDIGQTGGVSLSNVVIRTPAIPEGFPCTLMATQIVCSAIPDLYGSATDDPRELTVFADTTATDPEHASIRLTLNTAGDPDTDGSVSWSDGSVSFGWLGLPEPVAEGTYFRY